MDRNDHSQSRNRHDDQTAPARPEPERPVDVLRDGSLKASLWRNEGDKGPFYATEFSRTYTDADGNPRDSRSFVGGDLLKLSELARKAYDRTNELRREDFRRERQSRDVRDPGRTRRDRG